MIEQDELMVKIRNFNTSIIDQKPCAASISEFLNEPSPSKKRKVAHTDDADNDSIESSTDGSKGTTSAKATTYVRKK